VLLGPTGAGKTTLLRLVSGLDTQDSGDIRIGGQSMAGLTPAQRNVAMVFQQYSLYPHMTVRQNLEFPLKSPLLRTPQAVIDQKVKAIAEVLQIAHKLDNGPFGRRDAARVDRPGAGPQSADLSHG
jgi:multiple sugar transport system ATP-binding protein